jgi:TRAP-type mannitol/chloroaromatic compound transport system permease small subunit
VKAILKFIDIVDGINLRIGKVTMFGLFALMAVLLWSSVSKTFFTPSLWTLETAQFIMVGYYMLGGPYSILMGSNVRMDLFYGNWSLRRKATIDSLTVLFLIFYLGVMFYGALGSTAYSLGYWGTAPFEFFAGLTPAPRKSAGWNGLQPHGARISGQSRP